MRLPEWLLILIGINILLLWTGCVLQAGATLSKHIIPEPQIELAPIEMCWHYNKTIERGYCKE